MSLKAPTGLFLAFLKIKLQLLYLSLLIIVSVIAASGTRMHQLPDGDVQDIVLTEEQDKAFGPTRPWKPGEVDILNASRTLALTITSDTEFRTIVLEAAAANEIAWPSSTLENLPVSARDRPTEWVLSRLDEVGHFPISEIRVGDWLFNPPRKATRAKTVACTFRNQLCTSFRTRFHPAIVRRKALIPLANTFIHERIHAIGQVHVSQRRRDNRCEAPSVIGDIAESLLARRERGRPITPRQRLCPSLNARLRARNIVR